MVVNASPRLLSLRGLPPPVRSESAGLLDRICGATRAENGVGSEDAEKLIGRRLRRYRRSGPALLYKDDGFPRRAGPAIQLGARVPPMRSAP
ncbi:Uncharacterised protein [Mycobacterium tuberculosis]|nr:Uncharacterised protein [Mycobacterium tuberculosis]